MKRHAASVIALACLLAGCGKASETYLLVTVQRGSAQGAIDQIELRFTLAGRMATSTLREPTGGDIQLPTTATFHIVTGDGLVSVTAIALHAGVEVSRGTANGTITRGSDTNVTVDLGGTGNDDGGVSDGGGDGALDGSTVASLELSPLSHDYGAQLRGQAGAATTFTVTNSGGSASTAITVGLSGADAAAFSLSADTCTGTSLAAGGKCTVGVAFAPTAAAAASASLDVSASTGGTLHATLTGTGVDAGNLSVAPATFDFGSQVTGGMSNTTSFTVSNGGGLATGTLATMLSGSDAGQFAVVSDGCAGQVLQAAHTCSITARFAPTTTGPHTASLSVTATPGGAAIAALSGNGLAPGLLAVTPATRDFGGVASGSQSAGVSFTVTNSGGAATGNIATSVTGANASDFGVSGDTCNGSPLAAGGSCTVTVRFAPTATGARAANLGFTASPGGTTSAMLMGTGQAPAAIVAAPSSLDFGMLATGRTSADQSFTLQNGGQQTTGPLMLTLTGGDYAQSTGMGTDCVSGTTTLAAGASCTVRLHFAPAQLGTRAGSVAFTATPGGGGTVALTGVGITPANLTLSAASVAFGATLIGTPVDKTVIVTNSGAGTATPLAMALSGTGQAAYALLSGTGGDCVAGGSLAGGASCNVRIRFTPAAGGSFDATLTVSATVGGTQTASLNGSGQRPAILTPSPAMMMFAGAEVGTQGNLVVVTVSNGGDLPSGALSVTNSNGANFTITVNNCQGMSLAAGGTCTLTVRFNPTAGGVQSVTINVTGASSGNAVFTATGTGMYRLSVLIDTQLASCPTCITQSGDVPRSIDCGGAGATCTALYAGGSQVTLTAGQANGSGRFFSGFTGATCVGPVRTCTITLAGSLTVTAKFLPLTSSLMFVTTATFPTNLGGVLPYDAQCNTVATAAGLNSNAGTDYVAWISSSTSTSKTRLGVASTNFQRLDGREVAPDQTGLFGTTILNPVAFDETGKFVPSGDYVTGQNRDGSAYFITCADWTMASATMNTAIALRSGGPGAINGVWGNGCDRTYSLMCVRKGGVGPAAANPASGKHLWVTNDVYHPGTDGDPDLFCQKAAELPTGVVAAQARALVAHVGVAASAVLSPNTLYVRVDGQPVGLGSELIGNIETGGEWQMANGTYSQVDYAWCGSYTMGSAGDATTTCGNWAGTTGSGAGGWIANGTYAWFGGTTIACTTPARLYCVEQ